jgi:hypothetical protein
MPRLLVIVIAVGWLCVPGCGPGASDWEIVVENRDNRPVTVTVVSQQYALRDVKLNDLAGGEDQRLTWGSGDARLWRLEVVSAAGKQELSPVGVLVNPDGDLKVGKRYRVVIDPSGKATIEVETK